MAFWLVIIICILGCSLLTLGVKSEKWYNCDNSNKLKKFIYFHGEGFSISGLISLGVSLGVLIFMIGAICVNYATAPATVARYNENYKALVYNFESGACRDELGLLNKSVIDEIQHWNETIATKQAQQREFWTGIFTPNVYDQFKTIDYTTYNVNLN